MEKLCIFCEHFGWESISEDDYWGKDGGAFCRKSHFKDERPRDEEDLRKVLVNAESCPDYELPSRVLPE